MNTISIYFLATGQYSRTVGAATEELLLLQLRDGEKGLFDIENPSSYYLESDQETLVALPPKPDSHYVFDYNIKQWVDPRTPDQQYQDAATVVIEQRNELLYQSDWTQIPNNPLTSEQQQEWAVYRQQLRDITMQSGYPFTVIWPIPPQG